MDLNWLEDYFGPPGAPLANVETGTINDVATTSDTVTPKAMIRFSGAAPTVTGLAHGRDGRRLLVSAAGGPLVLANENTGSAPANRIVTGTGANITVPTGAMALLAYDLASLRWRLEGSWIMGPTEKAKLDGLQKQGASVAIAAFDIDWSLGGLFEKTLAAGANVFTFSNATDGWMITVVVTSDAGGSTLAWPTVKWPGGTPPTQTATGTDVYTFCKVGSTIYGAVQQAMA